MATLIFLLNLASALTAGLAAWKWYQSAAVRLPPFVTYIIDYPSDHPFFTALGTSMRLNKRAATFAAVSAGCFCIATILQVYPLTGCAILPTGASRLDLAQIAPHLSPS